MKTSNIVMLILSGSVAFVFIVSSVSHFITGVSMSDVKSELFAYTIGQVIAIIAMWVGNVINNKNSKKD